MKERGILFQGRLVLANIEDRKTETRRVGPGAVRWLKAEAGDILWVRETYKEGRPRRPDEARSIATGLFPRARLYKADGDLPHPDWIWPHRWTPSIHMPRRACRLLLELREKPWREDLHDITEQGAAAEGVERAHLPMDAGRAPCGAGACGGWLHPNGIHMDTARDTFRDLWDSSNIKRGYPWKANPMVTVLRYRRLKA